MVNLQVNGQSYSFDGDPSTPLLWVLRDELLLTGTKYGCGIGLCGACTVHLGGEAARACLLKVSDVGDKEVVTIEGLSPDGNHPVQVAWRETSAPQCGFCHAGQIMQASALLAGNAHPTDEEITTTMAGNICRCGCYQRIAEAIRLASAGV
jgi:isoquinoline 1-oxidoreductase subunit alpha